jgi:hypothetical protein
LPGDGIPDLLITDEAPVESPGGFALLPACGGIIGPADRKSTQRIIELRQDSDVLGLSPPGT